MIVSKTVNGKYWIIEFNGQGYAQRAYVFAGSDPPIMDQEEVVIALCEELYARQQKE